MNLSEIQIDVEALRHNVLALKKLLRPGQQVSAVVKANGYGHGLKLVVEALEGHVTAFQVDDLEELLELRSVSRARALVFGYVPATDLEGAIRLDAELGVFDRDHLALVGRTSRSRGLRPKVHLKVDALLGRLGCVPAEIDGMIEELRNWPQLQVQSAYAHYANIEDTTDLTHALAQSEAFETAFGALRHLVPGLQRHLSATSGLMTVEQSPPNQRSSDLIRLGIGLYGMYPSVALARTHADLDLRPALRWVTHLAQVKELPAGHPVGYGLTYVTGRPTRIGIVPQGYSDGYDRGLSNCGEVLVGGMKCPVIGRIAMNMFAVDLSNAPAAHREDEVVLLGAHGEGRITAEEIAAKLGTINYEVTSRISPLLPRVTVMPQCAPR